MGYRIANRVANPTWSDRMIERYVAPLATGNVGAAVGNFRRDRKAAELRNLRNTPVYQEMRERRREVKELGRKLKEAEVRKAYVRIVDIPLDTSPLREKPSEYKFLGGRVIDSFEAAERQGKIVRPKWP
ncbi:MAG: hypothetical protein HYW25_00615 [Candidatus Aenigmarchaeota archaeon]|nr:hypothetical protein [Candidatus Aenigmarchaeota archaeon]